MESSLDPENVYSTKQIQNLLKAKYGDDLFFKNLSGRRNVVRFPE